MSNLVVGALRIPKILLVTSWPQSRPNLRIPSAVVVHFFLSSGLTIEMEDYVSTLKQFSIKPDFRSKHEKISKGRPTLELNGLLPQKGWNASFQTECYTLKG